MAEKVQMMALSPTMEEGTIARWHKKVGDTIKTADILCEVETDKAAMDYETTQEGVLLCIVVPEGQQAKVGDTIAVIGQQGEDFTALLDGKSPEVSAPKTAAEPQQPAQLAAVQHEAEVPAPSAATGRPKASPLARKVAAGLGVDIAQVPGTGPAGRIVRADVENAAAKAATAPRPFGQEAAAVAAPGLIREPLGQKRRISARRLTESVVSAPHYYLTVTAQVDRLFAARAALNQKFGEKLSLNAYLVKLAAAALTRHRIVNASFGNEEILYHQRVDIALAVQLADGLVTPVVRDCANKGVRVIEGEFAALIATARAGKLQPEQMADATFTISNLGAWGIEQFTAIINPPGAAILAVGAAARAPIVDAKGALAVATLMTMTLSCDHRLIDGAVGAAFLRDLKEMIEEPLQALL